MINSLINTELEYVKCFSQYYEDENIIRFWDENLEDMYCHNFTFLKDRDNKDEILEIILEEIKLRKKQNKKFLQIEANFSIDNEIISQLSLKPERTRLDYMYISPTKYNSLKGNNDCIIKEVKSPEILKDGIKVDILANAPDMGEEFAKRRIDRKVQIYRNSNKNVNLFICYHNDIPIGNCEFFINKNIAKMEDFDILEKYQRNGFGTSVLKHLLQQSDKLELKTAYVITDSEDTAKDMYRKCGFSKIGQKTVLLFSF